jgi:hypothetical protein
MRIVLYRPAMLDNTTAVSHYILRCNIPVYNNCLTPSFCTLPYTLQSHMPHLRNGTPGRFHLAQKIHKTVHCITHNAGKTTIANS